MGASLAEVDQDGPGVNPHNDSDTFYHYFGMIITWAQSNVFDERSPCLHLSVALIEHQMRRVKCTNHHFGVNLPKSKWSTSFKKMFQGI